MKLLQSLPIFLWLAVSKQVRPDCRHDVDLGPSAMHQGNEAARLPDLNTSFAFARELDNWNSYKKLLALSQKKIPGSKTTLSPLFLRVVP